MTELTESLVESLGGGIEDPIRPPPTPPTRELGYWEPEGEPVKTPTGVTAWNTAWIRRIGIRQTRLMVDTELDRLRMEGRTEEFRVAINSQLATLVNHAELQLVFCVAQLIALGLIVWRVW